MSDKQTYELVQRVIELEAEVSRLRRDISNIVIALKAHSADFTINLGATANSGVARD